MQVLTLPMQMRLNYFLSRFNTRDSEGVVIDQNRASCIMPTFTGLLALIVCILLFHFHRFSEAEGWVDFEVSLNGGPYYWKGMFYVETPSTRQIYSFISYLITLPISSHPMVWFKDETYHQIDPPSLEVNWDPFNLTMNQEIIQAGKK